MIGSWTSSTVWTCSSLEYLRSIPWTNGRVTVTNTYVSIEAEARGSAGGEVHGELETGDQDFYTTMHRAHARFTLFTLADADVVTQFDQRGCIEGKLIANL